MKGKIIIFVLLASILIFANFNEKGKQYTSSILTHANDIYQSFMYKHRLQKMGDSKTVNINTNLTKKLAELREASIVSGSIFYDIDLQLEKGTQFRGTSKITFYLKNTNNVFFEYTGNEFKIIALNGKKISEDLKDTSSDVSLRKDGFVYLPENLLKVGENEKNIQEVSFQSSYNADGQGLHSFTDIDGSQYLWSQGQPDKMNRLFPCFDQPDLKAQMRLRVSTPRDWVVISNEAVKLQNDGAFTTDWEFYTTAILPVYDFVLNAGPYKQIKAENVSSKYTISLYCRKSLHEHLMKNINKSYIIESVKKAIIGFEKLLDFPYPFSKADIVFVPEFPKNAMENPGAVTMNEKHIFRETPDLEQVSFRHHVLIHEIGHMWIGNLVTLKWWSDIWLNEALDDFLALLVSSKIFEGNTLSFTTYDPWVLANSFRNKNAYNMDSIETSHPVYFELHDVSSVISFFDELTYFKGNAVLKQLYYVVGEKQFLECLRNYVQKYKFVNASYHNFIQSFEGYIDIEKFNQEWLLSAGYNEISADWDEKSTEKESKIVQLQKPVTDVHSTLRSHKIKVGFFNKDLELLFDKEYHMESQESNSFTYDGSSGEVAVVIPNLGDWTWAKIGLDKKSYDVLVVKASNLKDVLTKNLVYRSLLERVMEAKDFDALKFINVMVKFIHSDQDEKCVRDMFEYTLFVARNMVPMDDPQKRKNYPYCKEGNMKKTYYILFDMLKNRRLPILKDFLYKNAIDMCFWHLCTDVNAQMLQEKQNLFKITDQEYRWKVLVHLYLDNFEKIDKKEWQAKLEKEDTSSSKLNYLAQIDVAKADEAKREELFNTYFDPNSEMSVSRMRYSMQAFNSDFTLRTTRKIYYRRYFSQIIDFMKKTSYFRALAVFEELLPKDLDDEVLVNEFETLSKRFGELNQGLQKILSEKYAFLKKYNKVKLRISSQQ